MNNLVFLELPSHIDPALRVLRMANAQCRVIALTPHVEYALEKQGLEFCRPEDYHSEEEIEEIGFDDLSSLENLCNEMDDFLQDKIKFLKDANIRPANLNWYQLKRIYNSVSIRAFILNRILERETPKKVFYFDTRNETLDRKLEFQKESVWSRLIPLSCESAGVGCTVIPGNTDPTVLDQYSIYGFWNWQQTVKSFGRRVLGRGGLHRLKLRYHRVISVFLRLRLPLGKTIKPKQNTILALESGYSIGHVLGGIKTHGTFKVLEWPADVKQDPVFTDGSESLILKKETWSTMGSPELKELSLRTVGIGSEIRSNSSLRRHFQCSQIDCYPVLDRRITRFLEIDLLEMAKTYLMGRAIIRSAKPAAVLAATMGDYRLQVLTLASRHEDVPFVVYRHGDSSGHIQMKSCMMPVLERLELAQSDYVLAAGDNDKEYLESSDICKATILAVGLADLDHLKLTLVPGAKEKLMRKYGLNPQRKLVIYAPTDMEGNLRMAPQRNRTPSLTFDIQRAFLDVFTEFPEIQFVFKLQAIQGHPCSPIIQVLQDLQPPNVIAITDPLTSVIPMADMFITDYPSTSFLQMLTTKTPILVCGHKLPRRWAPDWHPSVLDMWQERVAYTDDLPDFLNLMRTHFREGMFQPIDSSNTLLKQFGTHIDDGKSADRAHEFLKALI